MAERIELKNGGFTYDPRLDRVPVFDAKSRNYPAIRTLGNVQPKSTTWECYNTLDQGGEGACIGFAMAHRLLSQPYPAPSAAKLITADFAKKRIYWEAQKIDRKPGGSYPGAIPFYEGTNMLAGIKILKKTGLASSYEWYFGLRELILGVGHKGPAVLGLTWTEGMLKTDRDGFIHAQKGNAVGGHCILCRGVNVTEEYFILRNSWGQKFGKKGDCYISFDDMEFLLKDNGEAVHLVTKAIY